MRLLLCWALVVMWESNPLTRPLALPEALSAQPNYFLVGRYVLASVPFGYRLHRSSWSEIPVWISDQFSLPVEFLDSRVKLAVVLCEFISALLDLNHVDRPHILHFRTCVAVLSKRTCQRQIRVNSPT